MINCDHAVLVEAQMHQLLTKCVVGWCEARAQKGNILRSWQLTIQDFGIAAFLHDPAAMKAIAEPNFMQEEHSEMQHGVEV